MNKKIAPDSSGERCSTGKLKNRVYIDPARSRRNDFSIFSSGCKQPNLSTCNRVSLIAAQNYKNFLTPKPFYKLLTL